GRPATFDLTVRNTGDTPATNTMLTDTLPAGTSFVSASAGGQFSGGRVSWALGTLGVGESRSVSLTVGTNQIGSLLNTASVRAYCAEADAQAVLEVRGIPAILLEVIDLADPIELGANETYEITVLNQGSAPDTNIVVACVLPPEQEYVSATGPTQASTDGKAVTFSPLPSLAPKATAKYRVVVKGTQVGDVRFRLSLTSDQLESPVSETESTHIYE
ncbi:MAG: DUF11 domain-containing protein, partial [Phycisphaerae bacterium]|nr:DUF11 domain-containing protein [Phycisphaerae bacterium]